MHIKELIIDGFKSYANRTVISGWDLQFNAITGLNGTGKSNILDSICFVLGITNLSNVRVTNLQELIYKNGQARITKASVTIIFNNNDKSNSPVGYENCDEISVCRQIIVGGRNKYLINGITAQTNKVQNLFHSVSLNVNNPHFLIMQGRITKVLNMKPPEILSMIEEAAGTRMYETKKITAQKTIEKKQSKMEEIQKILTDEITPTLNRLKGELDNYNQWIQTNTEIERNTRFLIAYEYYNLESDTKKSIEEISRIQDEIANLMESSESHKAEITDRENKIQELTQKREEHLSVEFRDLEKSVNELAKQLVKYTSDYQHQLESIKTEEKTMDGLKSQEAELNNSLKKIDTVINNGANELSSLSKSHQSLLDLINTLQSQALGISVSDSDENAKGSLSAQLMEAEKVVISSDSAVKQEEIAVNHLKDQIKQKTKETKDAEKEYNTIKKDFDKKTTDLASFKVKLSQLDFNSNEFKQLESQKLELQSQLQDVSDKLETLSAETESIMKFDYFKTPGFDSKCVKGLVASLFKLKDLKYATALEVVAGGRLYNVVVDNEDTGKHLLSNGKLKKRITIIPLNKISTQVTNPAIVDRAKQTVGEDEVDLALELIENDPNVDAAMRYVFGNTLVCNDSHGAKQLAFNKNIRARTVTLEGDVYDPSGTLSGGSSVAQQPLLSKLTQATTLQDKEKLDEISKKLVVLQKTSDMNEELSEKIELLTHELTLIKKRLDASTFSQLQQQVADLNGKMQNASQTIESIKSRRSDAVQKCKDLEANIKLASGSKQNQADALEKQLSKTKSDSVSTGKALKVKQQENEKLILEKQSLVAELGSLENQIETLGATIKDMQAKANSMKSTVDKHQKESDAASNKLAAEKSKLTETDSSINALKKKCDVLQKKMSQYSLEIKKNETKTVRLQGEIKEKKTKQTAYGTQYSWIDGEKHLFGQSHSDYDFSNTDMKKAQTHLHNLTEQQEKRNKSINKKVIAMYDKAEAEYKELIKKRDIINADKTKIEEVIEELDRKKNETLKQTWTKVNKDFGSIFSTLLPHTDAKLDAYYNDENPNILEGLEVRVAFGAVWKESLTELSGGQRSLLALSLILALLLFKPAPMYILDEIDSALDLSHTQNIGHMIKTHFSQSQFIVVSLKEGMFNNANVLFKTKFVDGVSAVTRTVNNSLSQGKDVAKVLNDNVKENMPNNFAIPAVPKKQKVAK